MTDIYSVPVYESWSVPRDQVIIISRSVFMHPSTYMVVKFGRTPLWTRHMRGVIEAERDRRRRHKHR